MITTSIHIPSRAQFSPALMLTLQMIEDDIPKSTKIMDNKDQQFSAFTQVITEDKFTNYQ